MKADKTVTVGTYLVRRLEQAGLKHIFGVPGDYVLGFFDTLEKSNIEVVCNCNELNAGYAADAYARLHGIGGVCVTYGVGGFSLFNAVVGAFAERIPLVVLSGAPRVFERSHHHLLHHTTGDMNLQYTMYEKVTAASCALTNPEQAPEQIDKTIETCLRFKRPVYIEIPIDIVSAPCRAPGPFAMDTTILSDKAALQEAVSETASLLSQAKQPVILAGVEPHRLGICRELQDLVDHTGYPFATAFLGKTVLPEDHPQFVGVYGGVASWDSARQVVQKADIILCLGTIMTDMEIAGCKPLLDPSRMIAANSDRLRIKHHLYNHISLKDFMVMLKERLKPARAAKGAKYFRPAGVSKGVYKPSSGQRITVKRFYERIATLLDTKSLVIGETGDSIFNVANLLFPKGGLCIEQAFYLSIGYAVPATLGACLAAPDRRVMAFVGDGAFQMTAQELSTIIRQKCNPIVFVMNNSGYTIERLLQDGEFNDLQAWKYSELPGVFNGGWGRRVETEGDLEDALAEALRRKNDMVLIEVRLDKWDCSEALRRFAAQYKGAKVKE